MWSWWESNPRPNKEFNRFLHVYCFLIVGKGKENTTILQPYLLKFCFLVEALKKLAQSFYDASNELKH